MFPDAFRRRVVVLLGACALSLAAAPIARSQPIHQVAPGESLWQIAAANGLPAGTLAAANGLPTDAAVQAGQVLSIPAGGGPTVAPAAAASAAAAPPTAPAAGGSTSTSSTGSSAGGVVVQPGDSLSAIASRAGVSVVALAAHNGLNASALLPAGARLSLPAVGSGSTAGGSGSGTAAGGSGAGSSSTSAASGTGAATPTAAPAPTTTTAAPAASTGPVGSGRVSAADVGATAAANGVPASLARAIAWQESGFDNAAVSSVGAQGVMQVMPGTWSFIDSTLSPRRLDPTSAADNVTAGTLYLRHLLQQTGGDPDQAAAAYYQGLSSVRARGMYDDTKRYVQNVRALRSRFGG